MTAEPDGPRVLVVAADDLSDRVADRLTAGLDCTVVRGRTTESAAAMDD